MIDLQPLSFDAIGDDAGLIACLQGGPHPRRNRPAEVRHGSHIGAVGQNGFDCAIRRETPGSSDRNRSDARDTTGFTGVDLSTLPRGVVDVHVHDGSRARRRLIGKRYQRIGGVSLATFARARSPGLLAQGAGTHFDGCRQPSSGIRSQPRVKSEDPSASNQ